MMPPTEQDQAPGAPSRSPLSEVLAARVMAASEEAIAASHASTADRRLVHEREWAETEDDSLAQLDEVANTLQGFAAWAATGAIHPRAHDVTSRLRSLAGDVEQELKARLRLHLAPDAPLMRYVDALASLRSTLADYFAEQQAPAKSV